MRTSQKTGELAPARRRIQELENSLGETQAAPASVGFQEKDRLEKIHGIGPVFATRLKEASVHTFADVSKMSSDRVRDIISPKEWQAIDPLAWIAEAGGLVKLAEVNAATGI